MKLRFFFDWSGDYLWSGDAQSNTKYGYPVDPSDLPLSPETKSIGEQLSAEWIAMARGERGSDETLSFQGQARDLHERIASELGSEFEVLYEVGAA